MTALLSKTPSSTAASSRASMRDVAARPAVRGWVLAVTVYFLAVFHRSSLGVAGLIAEHRFGITAAQLGTFVLLQIGVYAAMQVPTGVLVDRYGPRRMLVAASALMGVGQLLFAIAPSYPTALLARALLGCGDAMTFVSVLRYAAARFSSRRYPLLVAFTGTIGTIGNLLATLPLGLLLVHAGWTPTFGIAAGLSLVAAFAIATMLDDTTIAPARVRRASDLRRGIRSVGVRVGAAWSMAGTRVGFWVHFATMCTATTLSLLWGHPYLVDGVGFSSEQASTVLMIAVLVSGIAGPVVGWFIGGHANLRVGLALTTSVVTVVGWSVVALCLGDHPAKIVVAPLFVFTMLGGPASMVAFALARDYNPGRIVGTASGVVNVGGFVATATSSLVFGFVLTALGGTSAEHLRYALLVPVGVQLFGAWRVAVWFRRLRREVALAQRAGEQVPVRVVRRFPWDATWDG